MTEKSADIPPNPASDGIVLDFVTPSDDKPKEAPKLAHEGLSVKLTAAEVCLVGLFRALPDTPITDEVYRNSDIAQALLPTPRLRHGFSSAKVTLPYKFSQITRRHDLLITAGRGKEFSLMLNQEVSIQEVEASSPEPKPAQWRKPRGPNKPKLAAEKPVPPPEKAAKPSKGGAKGELSLGDAERLEAARKARRARNTAPRRQVTPAPQIKDAPDRVEAIVAQIKNKGSKEPKITNDQELSLALRALREMAGQPELLADKEILERYQRYNQRQVAYREARYSKLEGSRS